MSAVHSRNSNWPTSTGFSHWHSAIFAFVSAWGLPFYVKNGKDICCIKPDKDFIAFGFGEVVNPAREEGAHMHAIEWTLTALDATTE